VISENLSGNLDVPRSHPLDKFVSPQYRTLPLKTIVSLQGSFVAREHELMERLPPANLLQYLFRIKPGRPPPRMEIIEMTAPAVLFRLFDHSGIDRI